MKSETRLFCGIEGGGTKTVVELANEKGEILAQITGNSSNPWSLGSRDVDGFVLAARVFHSLIKKGIKKIEQTQRSNNFSLESVVICYSGGGSQVANERLLKALRDDGLVDCKISLGNDCLAPIFTAFKNGGVVLISGTGSNCILVNPIDESCKLKSLDQINISNSGGWGNLLGDEGSAYWIAQKAIKYLIDVNDNFLEIDDDVTELEKLIFEHFQVKSLSELLPHFYSDFKKDFIASLTLKLSIASESNPLFRSFFEEAGYQLARHIVAIQPKVSKKLINCPKGLPIVCAGSVYKSWNLIKPGFIQCLRDYRHRCADLKKINLVKIEDHSAVGAVLLAARIYNSDLDFLKTFDYASLTSQLDQIDVDSIVVHKNYTLNLNYFTSYIKGILW